MRKLFLVLILVLLATPLMAISFSNLSGQVGINWQQENALTVTNFSLKVGQPVTIGDINLSVYGIGTFWNGGSEQGANGTLGIETGFDGVNGRIFVEHNGGRDAFRGILSSSNKVGVYYGF